jgi:hypothetical protein
MLNGAIPIETFIEVFKNKDMSTMDSVDIAAFAFDTTVHIIGTEGIGLGFIIEGGKEVGRIYEAISNAIASKAAEGNYNKSFEAYQQAFDEWSAIQKEMDQLIVEYS